MKTIIKLFLMGVAIMISAYIIPGVRVDGFLVAVVVAVILSIVNFLIKPIVTLLTLPINILTLGLFNLVINALMIMLVSSVVPGFFVASFGWAVLFGIVLSLVNGLLGTVKD
ncbi:MAG: phage holin family protein [Candidatus Shapirobacteria bacterium]|nr:phage holin family protein [Candidatus Shapirobacteria bacterium]